MLVNTEHKSNFNFPTDKIKDLSNREVLKLSAILGLKLLDLRKKIIEILDEMIFSQDDLEEIDQFIKSCASEKDQLKFPVKVTIDSFYLGISEVNAKFSKNLHCYLVPKHITVEASLLFKSKLKSNGDIFFNARVDKIKGDYKGLFPGERIILKSSQFSILKYDK